MAIRPEDFGAVAVKPEDFGAEPIKASMSWADVPGKALSNIPSSSVQFASGIGTAIAHPLQTVGSLWDAAAGGLRNSVPEPVRNIIDRFDASQGGDPESIKRIADTAGNLGKFYKDRYGSLEGLKNTIATDPVGAAADLSTVLAGGAGVAKMVGANTVSGALKTASTMTNPMTPTLAVAKKAGQLGGKVASNVLGLGTGTSAGAIEEAAIAGKAGGTTFMGNITGKVPMTDVLDEARKNLSTMKESRSNAYRNGMIDVANDKTVLDFSGIDKAISDADKVGKFQGQVKNPNAVSAVQNIKQIVSKWKDLDPNTFHTPEGMDALKQRIGAIQEGIPYQEGATRTAVGKIYNSVKNEISQQAPVYSKVMKDYSQASQLIGEIEKTLSQNPKASVDTALRKLQSVMRNNVNTNWGNRNALVEALQQQGGRDLMPALAGQALSSPIPRGLAKFGMGGIGALSVLSSPSMLALLPATSPLLVGLGAYGAGKVAGSPLLPNANQAGLAALLASRAGQNKQ